MFVERMKKALCYKEIKPFLSGWLFLLFLASTLLACGEDDLKKAVTISVKEAALSKDRSYGVDVVYSDSAIVKAKGFAPVLDKVTPKGGALYNEMPEGVKIEFFDAYMQVTGNITSDYAINKEADRITIFRKNVVIVNDRMTFTTEELTWDENTRTFTSPAGTLKTKDGNTIYGTEFWAPQDFSTYRITQASGSGYVTEDLNP